MKDRVVRITGSHQAISACLVLQVLDRKTDCSDSMTWFDAKYIFRLSKTDIHRKFPKCYLFLDKAKQHHTDRKKYWNILINTINDTFIPSISTNSISRVYGTRRDMAYSQERSA